MTRYIVTKTRIAYGYVTEYSFTKEEQAKALMAKLDNDVRYTYTYRIEKQGGQGNDKERTA